MYTYKLGGMLITDELYHDDLEAMTFGRKDQNELMHYGIKGQSWGKRRFQNEDGSLTMAGRNRYDVGDPLQGSTNRAMAANRTYATGGGTGGFGGVSGGGGNVTSKGSPTIRTYGSFMTPGGKSYEFHDGPGQSAGRTVTNKVKAKVNDTVNSGRKAADNLFGRIGNWASNAAKDVGNAATNAYNGASRAVNDAANWVGDRAKDVGNAAVNAYKDASNFVDENITGNSDRSLAKSLNMVADAFPNSDTSSVRRSAEESQAKADNSLFGRIGNAAKEVSNFATNTAQDIGKAATNAYNDVSKAAGDAVNWVGDRAQDVGGVATNAYNDASKAVTNVAQDVGNLVGNAARDVGNFATNAANDVGRTATNAYNDASKAVGNASRDAGNWLGNAFNDAKNWVGNAGRDVGNFATNAYNDASKAVTGAANDVGNWAGNAARDVSKWAGNVADDVGYAMKDASNGVSDFFTGGGHDNAMRVRGNAADITANTFNQFSDAMKYRRDTGYYDTHPEELDRDISYIQMLRDRYDEAVSNYNDAKNEYGKTIPGIAENVGNAVSNAAKDVGDWASNAASDVANWGAGAIDKGKTAVSNFFSELVNPHYNLNANDMKSRYEEILAELPKGDIARIRYYGNSQGDQDALREQAIESIKRGR